MRGDLWKYVCNKNDNKKNETTPLDDIIKELSCQIIKNKSRFQYIVEQRIYF